MYSPIPPYKSGYVKTTNGHELYFELWGNPKGKKAVFLHGGPGLGFDDNDKRYFDPEKWFVLFFDQRGAGKSTPFASIEHNTTQDLMQDVKKLMDFVGFEKAVISGWSWGSTLALCFAISHPAYVSGLIVRGIYLVTDEEKKYYLQGGASEFFPVTWERFMRIVPKEFEKNPIAFYYQQIKNGNEKEKELASYEFTRYEVRLLFPKVSEQALDKMMTEDPTWKALGPLEIHYMANDCFLPHNFILENTKNILDIPISIIQGKLDFVCPPKAAYILHKALPKSRFFLTTAGHMSSEKENEKRIISEVKRMSGL